MPKSRTRRASIISDDEFSEQAIQVIKKIKRGNVEVSRIKADITGQLRGDFRN